MAGGFPEFIVPGRHGYLLAPGDVEGMIGKALLLLSDEHHWLECSEACLQQAKRYETALLVEQYEAYYMSLVEDVS